MLALLGDPALAEDCAQDAYLRAFRAWPRWKPEAPAEAWIHRIAINVAISARRRERLRDVMELVRRLGVPSTATPDELVGHADLLRELRALPPRRAAALILRHYHGYSNREIARSLGIPERTVASRLARARAQLIERLDTEWGTPRPARVPTDE